MAMFPALYGKYGDTLSANGRTFLEPLEQAIDMQHA
jgi:hypothetical protein